MTGNPYYVFIVEKGIDGLLAALYVSFTEKIIPKDIFLWDTYQTVMGAEVIHAGADEKSRERVKKALFKYGGDLIIYHLKACLSSDEPMAYMTAFDFAYLTLATRRDVSKNHANPKVAKFNYTVNKVLNEKHRLKGFIRFTETDTGVLYAAFAPDNDIVDLIAPHFAERLQGIPFVLHDLKRNRVAVSDGKLIKYGYTDTPATVVLSDDEERFKELFAQYFKDVNIPERKNLRQQNNYMPKKYRKFMFETYENN